jgi:hypothetical protein
LCSLALIGCSGYTGVEFEPRPARVESPLPGGEESQQVRALATVIGVRRQDQEPRYVVDVRVRIENNTDTAVTFDPRDMTLMDARLQSFGEPTGTGAPIALDPGNSTVVDSGFPYPPDVPADRVDLDSLTLRWRVNTADNRAIAFSSTFRRDWRDEYYYPYGYYGPYWGPRWGYYGHYWWPHHYHGYCW